MRSQMTRLMVAFIVLSTTIGSVVAFALSSTSESIPTPIFSWQNELIGTYFNGTSADAQVQSQESVDLIKDLTEGTIVVSFSLESAKQQAIVSVSTSSNNRSEFCFCVNSIGLYGVSARESARRVSNVESIRTANGRGRITAVFSVSSSQGAFLMSSQDFGEPWSVQRDSSKTAFFDSVSDLDKFTIGANYNSDGLSWVTHGRIYFVDIYDQPLTELEAQNIISDTYIDISGGLSYVQSDSDLQFDFIGQAPAPDSSTVAYHWKFNNTKTSMGPSVSHTFTTADFEDGVPVPVTMRATITSSDKHHGYSAINQVFVAPKTAWPATSGLGRMQSLVFRNGDNGFGCFRIPAIIRAGNGDLLAFAEGRPRAHCPDFHYGVSVVMKRSHDNGRTWGDFRVIAENIIPTTKRTWVAQNVTPMLDMSDPDHPEGKLIIVYNKTEYDAHKNVAGFGVRRVITAWSGDHGYTWNYDPVLSPAGTHDGDITSQVTHIHQPEYTAVYDTEYVAKNYNSAQKWPFNMTTLGHSIQLKNGPPATKDRLFISGAYSLMGDTVWHVKNYVYWSDDHGATWEIGGVVPSPVYGLNEVISVELENGDVLMNARAYYSHRGYAGRVTTRVSFDNQGNPIFGPPTRVREIRTQDVAGGMGRITSRDDWVYGRRSRIAFTSPNDASIYSRRNGMSLWMSTNEGESWSSYFQDNDQTPKLLNVGPSVYSDIVGLPDARVGVIYEGTYVGSYTIYGNIFFGSYSLDWLSNGLDQRSLIRHDASGTEFDGDRGHVDLSSMMIDSDVEDLSTGSLFIEFKTGQLNVPQVLFSISNSKDESSEWIVAQWGDGRFGVHARNDGVPTNTTVFDQRLVVNDQWHKMAVIVSDLGTKIYVDGQLVVSSTDHNFFDSVSDLDSLNIGKNTDSGGDEWCWKGEIGLVEVFGAALTDTQAQVMTQPSINPVGLWNINRDIVSSSDTIDVTSQLGGADFTYSSLPRWNDSGLLGSWSIGASFIAPDAVDKKAPVLETHGGSQQLLFGIVESEESNMEIGLSIKTDSFAFRDLMVDASPYLDKDVSMLAVVNNFESRLYINGQLVKTVETPKLSVSSWKGSNLVLGGHDSYLGSYLKSVAIFDGVAPSDSYAKSLTASSNIIR